MLLQQSLAIQNSFPINLTPCFGVLKSLASVWVYNLQTGMRPCWHASVLLALYRSSFARDHVCIAPYPASSRARLCLCHRLRATHTSGMSQNAIGEHENEKAQNRTCTALISSFNALNLAGERCEGETLDLEVSAACGPALRAGAACSGCRHSSNAAGFGAWAHRRADGCRPDGFD